MTEDIKKQITVTKDVTILTRVTCDCCKRELGMFHMKWDRDTGCGGFKDMPNAKPVEWYHVVKSQNYDRKTEWPYDICPDCLPAWITEFRDKELGCDDYMELHIEHNIHMPQILEEES